MKSISLTKLEQDLCHILGGLPAKHSYKYSDEAHNELLAILFSALVANDDNNLSLLFPTGLPQGKTWNLKEAQGAVDGAEYTAGARGKACGHIFKCGETSYRCRNCSLDDTCVLCSRCFDASDHQGHTVSLSVSSGNSGCCDCGDLEAWRVPVACAIHSDIPGSDNGHSQSQGAQILPAEVRGSIRATISRVLDYMCDVISCSPEHLREPKTENGVRTDEAASLLHEGVYGSSEKLPDPEYSMILWNDEKHTVEEVKEQLKKACRVGEKDAAPRAQETNDVGRTVVQRSSDLPLLLHRAGIIEQIKITVTVRSSRDTFREQMCGTMIEWLQDISGCRVGEDFEILRQTICEEMFESWRLGSSANNAMVGKNGIDDLEKFDSNQFRRYYLHLFPTVQENQADEEDEASEDFDIVEEDELDLDEMELDEDDMPPPMRAIQRALDSDTEMSGADDDDALEMAEATLAGYPRPPPPQTVRTRNQTARQNTDNASPINNAPDAISHQSMPAESSIPATPKNKIPSSKLKPAAHWLEKPKVPAVSQSHVGEDLRRRVRLDFLLMFDLRLWKRARIGLRELYMTTVVTIPQFKRLLGLRLAAFYPTLAQLFLIADREPDHSIINLSIQILTTPSITNEVVERSNFLTNLFSIVYTFLTKRQVGHPHEVDAGATLAFEAGSLTNRRLYHFFMDLRHMLSSADVQEKIRQESRYTLQFLDLVKLHQGICPNTRAVGDHVEYENDAWISASLITREINKLCRQFSEPFKWQVGTDPGPISNAMRLVATTAMLNSLGLEKERFTQSEIRQPTKFKFIKPFEFDQELWIPEKKGMTYNVVDFELSDQPISFHHALHYTLSWFIDGAKSMSRQTVRALLAFKNLEFRPDQSSSKTALAEFTEDQLLLALYDFPLRVCAWLAQMKAGIWVRNGLSLRHQSSTYRGVGQRDVAHQRDIFLLQSALVICDPSLILMSMIDRFGMYDWVSGLYDIPRGFEEKQTIEVAEDFVHLLIVLLTDRTSLLPTERAADAQKLAIKRDIIHVLCFKPLSFSELTTRLADRYQETDEFEELLEQMTKYRPPEGLSDYGTFELREEYLAELDPYIAHYNKNQRDESETAYRAFVSKYSGKPLSEVVYEPKLLPIESGLFTDLSAFTSTNVFAQIVYTFLSFVLDNKINSHLETGRWESFLQVVLHLTLIAVLEDEEMDDEFDDENLQSFCFQVLLKESLDAPRERNTIFGVMLRLLEQEEFDSCFPKINLIFRRLKQKRPRTFSTSMENQDRIADRMDTDSPANPVIDEKEIKRKRADESRAKVMAHFQKEQQNFMNQQTGIDWGVDDFSDTEEDDNVRSEDVKKTWKYPSGTCIFCQDAVNESRIYGTFGMMIDSNLLRQTDLRDTDFLMEAVETPDDLDQSADHLRPFGVSGRNVEIVEKMAPDGTVNKTQRRGLGKGFPYTQVRRGPVTTGCGHLMHYDCFEAYYAATARRQAHQVSRDHPERLAMKEFVCPLCKAIGNTFLPIIWKSKIEQFPGALQCPDTFDEWLGSRIGPLVSRMGKAAEADSSENQAFGKTREIFGTFASQSFVNNLTKRLERYAQPPTPRSQVPTTVELTPATLATDSEFIELHELNSIYKRLRDTIRCNSLTSNYSYPAVSQHTSDDLTFSDTLARTLGQSITSVEIAQRGIQSERGSTWLQNLSESSLTHLRIFSETVFSYIAVGGLRNSTNNKNITEFWDMRKRQLHQLFIGHSQLFESNQIVSSARIYEPLFLQDTFIFLTECTMYLIPSLNLDIYHIMRLCYVAEVVKVITALLQEIPSLEKCTVEWRPEQSNSSSLQSTEVQALKRLIRHIVSQFNELSSSLTEAQVDFLAPIIYRLSRSYALPFLRKCVLLLHTKYCVDFSSPDPSSINEPELERLSKLTRLPSLFEIFTDIAGFENDSDGIDSYISQIALGWIRHWMAASENRKISHRRSVPLSLPHPTIFELVGLPETFDVLLEQVMRQTCPTTGKDMSDPSVCLFCGQMFCSQAYCCLENNKLGGCNQHVRKCGGQLGIFINIRKCCVLYLHRHNGSWSVAPYLDRHGETDPGLRRHQQLFLHQKRYDALLRAAWLNHSIPSTISRKLEADINNGGWETI